MSCIRSPSDRRGFASASEAIVLIHGQRALIQPAQRNLARFPATSAVLLHINNHLRNVDKSRAYALVDGILAAGRKPPVP